MCSTSSIANCARPKDLFERSASLRGEKASTSEDRLARHDPRIQRDALQQLITTVVPASPAETLGIKVDDVLVRYRNACANAPADLVAATGKTVPADSIPMELFRDGKRLRLTARGGKLGIATIDF